MLLDRLTWDLVHRKSQTYETRYNSRVKMRPYFSVLAKRQPGGRHIELALLPFPWLMWWLGQRAVALFGLVDVLTTEYPIETAR